LSLSGLSKVMVAQKGSLEELVQLAGCDDSLSRMYAHGALASLGENFEYSMRMADAGAIAPLVKGTRDGGPYSRSSVLGLAQLTNLTELHTALALGGACNALLTALKRAISASSETGLEEAQYAALAVCNLAGNPTARQEFRRIGALEILSTLSRSTMAPPDIQSIAMAAIRNLTRNENTIAHVQPARPTSAL